MALSAEERRQWEGIERLLAEDPKLSRSMMDSGFTRRATRAAGTGPALAVMLVAFAVVLLAVIVKIPLIGIVGFVLMIMGGARFLRSRRMNQFLSGVRASRDVL